jgi:lipopolysaccharide export system permease protein
MASQGTKKTFIFYRYVLKEHIGPFFFALSLIVFLFLMNYTLREAHRLFGRGLDAIIIFKMFYYHLAPTLALAIPMSVLVSTSMAFVRIAADSEITILRSSGVGLNRIIFPLFVASIGIAIGVYFFNNTILPQYNIESSKIASEIRRLKPTATIYENTFTDVKSIKLYVEELDDNFNQDIEAKAELLGKDKTHYPVDHMFGVLIYDSKKSKKPRTIIADEGFIYLNPEKKIFELILRDGEIYEATNEGNTEFQHSYFKQTQILMAADEHVMEDVSNEKANYKSNRQKNSDELSSDVLREKKNIQDRSANLRRKFAAKRLEFAEKIPEKEKPLHQLQAKPRRRMRPFNILSDSLDSNTLLTQFKHNIRREITAVTSVLKRNKYDTKEINDLEGEWHKKYSIPAASIFFLLIGAPLGMMTKKGEAGKAAFVCLLVFIVYYVCLILGEELSEDGKIAPLIGIWSGNIFGFIVATIGYFLLRKELSLADFIDISKITKIFKRRSA